MVARDNHPATAREIAQKRCARRLRAADVAVHEAAKAVRAVKKDEIVMHATDAIMELIHLGDVLEVNMIAETFAKLKTIDRLDSPGPEAKDV